MENEDKEALVFATANDQGVQFATGQPVTFTYQRRNEGAPNFGSLYQQDIEPAGRYMVHNEDPGPDAAASGWETGQITFQSPLVIKFNPDNDVSYDEHSWKASLYRHYGKTGKQLSQAIKADGYDGIVTVGMGPYAKEIVDLTGA